MKKKIIIASCIAVIGLLAITGLNISTNYRQLQIRKEIIESEKISDKFNGTLIAYFSDLYFGENFDLNMVAGLAKKINAFNPDAVIFSGDLLSTTDINQEQQNSLIEQLSSIKCHYGKYAVLGDNDLISNEYKNLVTYILNESGFDIIDNTNRIISKDMADKIEVGGKPTDCVGCGACTGHCPQNIDTPSIMQELAELLNK